MRPDLHIELGGGAVLRPYTPADADALYGLIDSNRVRLARWFHWVDDATDVTSQTVRPYHRRCPTAPAAARRRERTSSQRGSRAASMYRRPADSGSSPVSNRKAIGIWRRRCTPSFCRSTSQ